MKEYTDIEYGENANAAGSGCALTFRNEHFIFGGGEGSLRDHDRITKGKEEEV